MTKLTFAKEERLKSKKELARLFKEGRSFSVFPIRVVWSTMEVPRAVPIQFTVSVPKRKFKHAVDRNRIKRQIRETYRLQKSVLINKLIAKFGTEKSFALLFIYVSTDKEAYTKIEKGVRKSLERLGRDMMK